MSARTLPETIIRVELAGRSYSLNIGRGLLDRAGEAIAALGCSRAFVLSDEGVAPLYLERLQKSLHRAGLDHSVAHRVPVGEESKSFPHLQAVLERFIEAGAERNDVIIALGGGVVGDLGGLVAGLLKRGCRVVQIPTSLLAQVDSSIGGKTAINSRHGKNLIGLFYQPSLVLADLDVLSSLPARHIRAGLAEIAKAAMICDTDLARQLIDTGEALQAADPVALAPVIEQACRIKARIVAADETEQGMRALLNLGHTFAHALETANAYRDTLLHGEAVGCGLGLALRYSARLGLCSDQQVEQGEALLSALGLGASIAELDGGPYLAEALIEHMSHDKKTKRGVLTLILLRSVGDAFLHEGADFKSLRRFLDEEVAGR